MARRFATRIRAIRVNRFAETPLFSSEASNHTDPMSMRVAKQKPHGSNVNAGSKAKPGSNLGSTTEHSRMLVGRSKLLNSSRKKGRNKHPYFHNVRAIRANRGKPAIHNFLAPPPPRSAIRKKGVQFGNPQAETIRENQAIRANLRIDSRESGHLSDSPLDALKWVWSSLKDYIPLTHSACLWDADLHLPACVALPFSYEV